MEDNANKDQIFVDLGPISRNIKQSIYQKAFDFCIGNKAISNIALTGPYGSGKSSVIKGLIADKNLEEIDCILEISLASFESKRDVTDQQIELSILQQMIYSCSANKLPNSRFKRIQKPQFPSLTSAFILLWLVAVSIGANFWKEILRLSYWSFEFLIIFPIGVFALIGTWKLIERIYIATFDISLKKVSLKNLELEKNDNDNSILNKYLDEILYFFSQTNYTLIVFEDIDRFDSPSVFIKLRELNTLINQNEDINAKRHIQFLYALKDSIFSERERTKFFDFIIPIVPVIGLSNSSDLFDRRIARISGLGQKVDKTFIKDLSEFVNDARLVNNTFNEFQIYLEEINDLNLCATSLLAMMIYKNFYGNDFENLHDSKGVFFSILNKHKDLVASQKEKLQDNATILKDRLGLAKLEKSHSEYELVTAYVGEIVKNSNGHAGGIIIGSEYVPLSSIKTANDIEKLVNKSSIATSLSNSHGSRKIDKNFEAIENAIDPNFSFKDRMKQINDRNKKTYNALNQELINLEKKILQIDGLQLNFLLMSDTEVIDSCIRNNDSEEDSFNNDLGLFRFLLFSGYLNENYALYTSIFREKDGWSVKDRRYFTTFKGRLSPKVDMPIDNPKEVCSRLLITDFNEKHVLNLDLFDYLLTHSELWPKQIEQALDCFRSYYEGDYGEMFMSMFLQKSQNQMYLFESLLEHWPEYFYISLKSSNAHFEIALLLNCVEVSVLQNHEGVDDLKNYIEMSLASIFNHERVPAPNINCYRILETLQVKIKDLESIAAYADLVKFITIERLYEINLKNILFLLIREGVKLEEAHKRTLHLIRKSNFSELSEYIEKNEDIYIEEVMLKNPLNVSEPADVVLSLICNKNILAKSVKKVITQQNHIFPSVEAVEEQFWAHLLETNKVLSSWKLIYLCFHSQLTNNEAIESYLNRDSNREQLLEQDYVLEYSEQNVLALERFIFKNSNFSDSCYIQLNIAIKSKWKDFPAEISTGKKILLARNGLIALNDESFKLTENDLTLRIELIKSNHQQFIENIDQYAETMSAELVLSLYKSELKDDFKTQLSKIVNSDFLFESEELCDLSAQYFLKFGLNTISKQVAETLVYCLRNEETSLEFFEIFHAKYDIEESLSLIIKKVEHWEESTTMKALQLLPIPYSLISEYGKRPSLPSIEQNISLAEALKNSGMISSYKSSNERLRIHTKFKRF